MTVALELVNLIKDYSAPDGETLRVLDIPHLSLEAGAELAVAGPSGSGKTTLLHLVAGLLTPTSGEVRIGATVVNKLTEAQRDSFRARQIGYVFQRANLLDGFSALENILLAIGFANTLPADERRERAETLLAQVGLSDRQHHRPTQLSSGQQQRVALARALANAPNLVLADEPTASVDYETGRQLVTLLRQSCAERGAALLFVSHDRELLASFERVVTLRAGRIVEPGPGARSQKPEAWNAGAMLPR